MTKDIEELEELRSLGQLSYSSTLLLAQDSNTAVSYASKDIESFIRKQKWKNMML